MTSTAVAAEGERAVADHAPRLERAFELVPEEGTDRLAPRGALPEWLRGSYYVIGPARFHRGELRYRHWLDGDGVVCALHFADDGVTAVRRFVRSQRRNEEEAAGRALYRAFGTRFAGDRLVRGIATASPVNVSVYPVAGRLLAFGEQGLPWRLDPRTLETLGEETFERRLTAVSPFSAHPGFDRRRGEMLSFGVSYAGAQPALHLYRFGPDLGLLGRRRLALPYPASIHDFGLSPSWAVFHVGPYLLDAAALARGATVLEALSWRPELESRLLVVSRDDEGAPAVEVPIGDGYCLHHVGSFEEDGLLVVDVVELDEPVYDQYLVPTLFPDVRRSQPVRYRVDVPAGRLVGRETLPYHEMCDFPAIDPRRAGDDYGDFWVLGIGATERPGRKFFDRLVHLDWRRGGVAGAWTAPSGSYLGGEPVFCPHPGDAAAGAVIVERFDAERIATSFLVFDAFDVAAGPVAELPLPTPLPPLFHAAFAPRRAMPG